MVDYTLFEMMECYSSDGLNNFSQGFDIADTNLPASLQSAYTCPCCCGFPRQPCQLRHCGHVFCQSCIKSVLDHSSDTIGSSGVARGKCPTCRMPFHSGDVVIYIGFSHFEQRQFTSIDVICPNRCGFSGTMKTTDEHQRLRCRLRLLKCPHWPCSVLLSADEMAKHFDVCKDRLIYCAKCGLPSPPPEIKEHDCLQRALEALERMLTFDYLLTRDVIKIHIYCL